MEQSIEKKNSGPDSINNSDIKKSYEDSASLLSRIFLLYMDPLLADGYQRTLEQSDLGGVSDQDKADELFKSFSVLWDKEKMLPPPKRSMWRVLFRTVGYWRLWSALLLYFLYTLSSYGPILILTALVNHFDGVTRLDPTTLWILVVLMFFIPMFGSVVYAHSNNIMSHIGVQFRNVLVAMIYRKSLKLSPSARQVSSTGQIINMFSADTMQLQRFMQFLNLTSLAPINIIISLTLIYQQVGVSTFVGLGFIIFMIPFNGVLFGFLAVLRTRKVKKTDLRVKLMNELLGGIRVIKYYAWEKPFKRKVSEVRVEELALLRKMAYAIAIGFTVIIMSAPTILPVLIFYTYTRLGNQLDAAKAFTTIALFNLLSFPIAFLPLGVSQYVQSKIACDRMLAFFDHEELQPYISSVPQQPSNAVTTTTSEGNDDNRKVVIVMSGVNMGWTAEEPLKGEDGERKVNLLAESKIGVDDKKKKKTAAKEEKEKSAAIKRAMGPIRSITGRVLMNSPSKEVSYEAADQEDNSEEGDEGEKKQDEATRGASNTNEEGIEMTITNDNKDSTTKEKLTNRSQLTLVDINVSIKQGQLVAVVGSVGSGKSSFLSGLLGEMLLQSGNVHIDGSIAYCDQRPWILNATVENNILFGLPYNEEQFDIATYASALSDDIKILPGGIHTQIGERGINLSGGQKARVALARAVYRNADIYLLDDPLSAVDAHVGQFLFHECIVTALSGKTRILVTHHVHFLSQCDLVVILQDGKVKASGTYEELQHSGIDLSAFVTQHKEEDENNDKKDEAVLGKKNDDNSSTGSILPKAESSSSFSKKSSPIKQSGSALKLQQLLEEAETARSEAIKEEQDKRAATTTSTPARAESSEEEGKIAFSAEEVTNDKIQELDAKIKQLKLASGEKKLTTEASKAAAAWRKADTRSSEITTKEEKNVGAISRDVYWYYIKSGGIMTFGTLILFMMLSQLSQILSNYWLQYWGSESIRKQDEGDELSTSRNIWFLNIFAAFSAGSLALYIVRSIALAEHRLGASSTLHKNLLEQTASASVSFFDVTPVGRILNRFSSDLQVVDEDLSQTLSQFWNSAAQVTGAVAAISGATKGTFLLLCVPLFMFYRKVDIYFRASNTAIARLESVSRSPIYADFSMALGGLTSIRAYGAGDRFFEELKTALDRNSTALVMQQLANQWLSLRLDVIGAFVSFFVALLAAASSGFIPPGFLALGLAYSFQLTSMLKFLVRMFGTLEAQSNSIERIKHYTDNIESEGGPLEVEASEIPSDWPAQGVITAKQISMRYRDGPLVLKDLSFEVASSEKVGVVGRTGSGKSSLMVALFRIHELAAGSIFIDGIDIATVPLSLLRSKLGIIPQDPVLFSATVRFNLDPFDEHTDLAIWEVLQSLRMKDYVQSLPGGLSESVAENGDNFSAGQRQLICIARAILRKPRILVLDEATASIDNETDNLVQDLVREQFQNCTTLTIAHRLHTIIESNRILVLDSGVLSEWDTPEALLAQPQGVFAKLWARMQKSNKGGDHENDDYENYDDEDGNNNGEVGNKEPFLTKEVSNSKMIDDIQNVSTSVVGSQAGNKESLGKNEVTTHDV